MRAYLFMNLEPASANSSLRQEYCVCPSCHSMAPAKRKATSSASERPPTKKFLRDRQLIVEGLPQRITKTQLSDFFLPYKIVDEVNIEVLQGATSRRTQTVTLARPNGLREAREVVSRLFGSDVNGCRVSIRLFGKLAHLSTTVPGTESTKTSFENEDTAQCQSRPTRRSIRASTRNSLISSSSEQLCQNSSLTRLSHRPCRKGEGRV